MKYNTIVSPNKNFQTSVNLQFDLNKPEKIDTYIPTRQSILLLKRYLNAVNKTKFNEDNATVLIGPYGRGKSHLLLILSALISSGIFPECKESIKKLIDKISTVDKDTAEIAKSVVNNKRTLLPIIINSNHNDINQSFIIALRDALEHSKMSNFFPKTYFDASISMITTWEKDYKSAYELFTRLLKKEKTTPSKLKDGLYNCNNEAYNLFCKIYPSVTSGAEFNPMQNADVVKLYSDVAQSLHSKKGYSGIFIIFDEFSKYLESAAAIRDMQNFKLIQDFSELATRSSEVQIHICCVTHKEILDYSQSDNFRTVDGRFKKVYFTASAEQTYELAANAVRHSKTYEKFYEEHKEQFIAVSQSAYRTGLFNELDENIFESLIVKRCFPLHPMTVFSLIKVSELVGQNERTLFTFLSQSGEYTLKDFIDQDFDEKSLSFITPDYIYDYFSNQFKNEYFNPKIRSIWAKTNTALSQATTENQKRIIKMIAIISIISEDIFLPVSNHIKTGLNMYDLDYSVAINELKENHIVAKKRNGQYAFLTPNGVDIKKSIHNIIGQGQVVLNRANILKKAYSISYILPRQYNSENYIMRYFKVLFLETSDLYHYNGDFSELMGNADGLIINLISDDKHTIDKVPEKLMNLHLPLNVLICTTSDWEDDDLLYEYAASCILEKSKESEDIHFKQELELYKEDLYKSIQKIVNSKYSPNASTSKYYCQMNNLDSIYNNLSLNREISKICSEHFFCVPKINNEMVNKNNLTSQIRKAREKCIDWILEHREDIPEMDGFGPELSILRSLIVIKGLDKNIQSEDENLNTVLKQIRQMITSAEYKKVGFKNLYDILTSSPYGMRKGTIPVYIAYVFREQIDNIVLYNKNKEVEISGSVLNNIEDNLQDYTFKLDIGTEEKDTYIDSLMNLFEQGNSYAYSNKKSYVLKLMREWFRGLPKFSRDHCMKYTEHNISVEDCIIRLRKKLLMYDINSYEFLYEFLPTNFECQDYAELYNKISVFKSEFDNFITDFKSYLIEKTKCCFGRNIGGSLFSVMKDWYESLSERTKSNIFDSDTNLLIKFIADNSTYDDDMIISSLAKIISTFSIEDWKDETVDIFIDTINKIVESVNDFDKKTDGEQHNDTHITVDFDGEVIEKSLNDTELSMIAETTMSNIESVFDDYADSINTQEKIAILLKLLKKEFDQM